MRDARQPEGIPVPKPPYSPVVLAGDLVFTAGQVAIDTSGQIVAGGIAEQTRQAMSNLAACLSAAGCSMDDVVKATVFLTDLGHFALVNKIMAEHFREPYPARAAVGVASLPRGAQVEVECIVAL